METRIVTDSMGEMYVPKEALYGAQTQRAILNFSISGTPMPAAFIHALGHVKAACATANYELGLLSKEKMTAIVEAANEVAKGLHDEAFPVEIYQTGSGTSSNMNANEVIAECARRKTGLAIHPNDDVNMSQSSNDVIPTTIHVSASIVASKMLFPSLLHLHQTLLKRAETLHSVVKTGRTHLMDAMPITMGQEIGGWAAQIEEQLHHLEALRPTIHALAIGGTAVGTGINADPTFGEKVSAILSKVLNLPFTPSKNRFLSLSSQDPAVAFSSCLKNTAVSLMKIANDLRWMNSGPLAGLAEISLPALQPGSSIMPGKVNPVIPEAVAMVCAKVIGNDATITIGGQSGNFQLNVMLPVIAATLLESIQILSRATYALADQTIATFTVNQENLSAQLACNPILITALNRVIGYELGAKIAKTAYQRKAPLIEVAKEMTSLTETELRQMLDPISLTRGGIQKAEQ